MENIPLDAYPCHFQAGVACTASIMMILISVVNKLYVSLFGFNEFKIVSKYFELNKVYNDVCSDVSYTYIKYVNYVSDKLYLWHTVCEKYFSVKCSVTYCPEINNFIL